MVGHVDLSDLLRIDVDEGQITRTPAIGIDSTGPLFIVVEPDRVILRPLDNVDGYVVPDGDRPQRLTGALAHGALAIYPGPDSRHVWMLDTDTAEVLHVDLVGIDGETSTMSVAVPGGLPRGPDGTGQALIQAPGGVYLIGPNGPSRVTTGQIIAAGPTRWLVLECDDHLDCTTATIDRTTGDRHILGPPPPTVPPSDLPFAGGGTVSPDGHHAAYVEPTQSDSHLQLVNLDTGEQHPIAAADVSASGTWTPTTVWSAGRQRPGDGA